MTPFKVQGVGGGKIRSKTTAAFGMNPMDNTTAIVMLSAIVCITAYLTFKSTRTIPTTDKSNTGLFCIVGQILGIIIGGYFSAKFIPIKSEASIGFLVCSTLLFSAIGGLLGISVSRRGRR